MVNARPDHRQFIFRTALLAAGALAGVGLLAPIVAPHAPDAVDSSKVLLAPNGEFWLGTDHLGRCVLSRLLNGARTSLSLSLAVVAISAVFGGLLGLIAAVAGGLVRASILKVLDVFLIVPGLIFSLVIAGLLGTGLLNLIVALAAVGWIRFARVSYTVALSINEREFVTAARAMGASRTHVLLTHLWPNVLPHLLILSSLSLGHTILSISALSFLGLGVQPPTPEWGAMLYQARTYLNVAPHLALASGAAIFFTVLLFLSIGRLGNDLLLRFRSV